MQAVPSLWPALITLKWGFPGRSKNPYLQQPCYPEEVDELPGQVPVGVLKVIKAMAGLKLIQEAEKY